MNSNINIPLSYEEKLKMIMKLKNELVTPRENKKGRKYIQRGEIKRAKV